MQKAYWQTIFSPGMVLKENDTVWFFPAALIADKVEMKYKELRLKKRIAELASDIWSDWHQAQANRQPSQYKDVLNYHDLPKEAKKPSS